MTQDNNGFAASDSRIRQHAHDSFSIFFTSYLLYYLKKYNFLPSSISTVFPTNTNKHHQTPSNPYLTNTIVFFNSFVDSSSSVSIRANQNFWTPPIKLSTVCWKITVHQIHFQRPIIVLLRTTIVMSISTIPLLPLYLIATASYSMQTVMALPVFSFSKNSQLKTAVDQYCADEFDPNSDYGWVLAWVMKTFLYIIAFLSSPRWCHNNYLFLDLLKIGMFPK